LDCSFKASSACLRCFRDRLANSGQQRGDCWRFENCPRHHQKEKPWVKSPASCFTLSSRCRWKRSKNNWNLRGTWEGELIHRKRGGERVAVSSLWVLHRDAKGKPARILQANTDISDRKKAEERLSQLAVELAQQAEALTGLRRELEIQTLTLRSVLDGMVEGLVATDEQGKFVLWNPAAQRILGMGAADIDSQEWTAHYGLFLSDTVTPFPSEQIPLVRALRGEVSTTEMFVRNPQLKEGAWIEVSAAPMKDKRGNVTGGVAAFRDVTQRRSDEREIRKLNDELELRVIERTAQ
jgi:PAS domain S-box-containing protein